MGKLRIKVLNKIAQEGLDLLDSQYSVSRDEPDPEGILVRSSRVDTDAYPSLLAVARAGAGVNNITVDQATSRGIAVFNTPGANANAVAELVFVMLGMAARNIHRSIDFCRELAGHLDQEIARTVEKKKAAFKGFELAGKTLGVLGLGKIGIRVANGGTLRQMRVVGFDPSPALENIHQLSPDVTLVRSRREVLAKSNVLSLHMPFYEKLRGMINEELLRQLPQGAILINYARGPLVDEQAVLAALDSGQLSVYITDFPTAAILHHPKVIASPHLGASTEESEEQCASMAVQELKDYLEYGAVTRSVNFPTAESTPSAKIHTRLIMINRDIPGMIGFASQSIGAAGINIASYLNESNGVIGYNIIDLEGALPKKVKEQLGNHQDVIRIRTLTYQ